MKWGIKTMKNENELMIKEIEKLEGRTKESIRNLINAAASTGIFASLSAAFAGLGLNSVARNEFAGNSVGCGVLALLCASATIIAYDKVRKYNKNVINKIEIYSDMAENQFVQKLQK